MVAVNYLHSSWIASQVDRFDGVALVANWQGGQINSYGSGAAIGNKFVLTAAHVASSLSAREDYVHFQRDSDDWVNIRIKEIHTHELYRPNLETPEFDLAVVELEEAIPSWSPVYEFYSSPVVYGLFIEVVGFGMIGVGGAASESNFDYFAKVWGTNRTEAVHNEGDITPGNWDEEFLADNSLRGIDRVLNKANKLTVLDYDSGAVDQNVIEYRGDAEDARQTRYEAIPQPGDSGAPILVGSKIMGVVTQGVTSWKDPDFYNWGNYGEISANALVSTASGWINFVSDGKTFDEQKIITDPVFMPLVKTGEYSARSEDQVFVVDIADGHIYRDSTGAVVIDSQDKYYKIRGFEELRVYQQGIDLDNYPNYEEHGGGLGHSIDLTTSDFSHVKRSDIEIVKPERFERVEQIADSTGYTESKMISERVEGGDGVDTIFAEQRKFHYSLRQLDDQSWLLRHDRFEVVDYLDSIERIHFDDRSVGLDLQGSSGKGYRLYKAAFDRTPDEVGLGYWINELDQGFVLHEVANSFVISQEFQNLYGADLNNEGFITALYNNVLDRNPDQGGLDYWVNDMENNGMSRADVLASFSESAENIANTDPLIELGVVYQPYGDVMVG